MKDRGGFEIPEFRMTNPVAEPKRRPWSILGWLLRWIPRGPSPVPGSINHLLKIEPGSVVRLCPGERYVVISDRPTPPEPRDVR